MREDYTLYFSANQGPALEGPTVFFYPRDHGWNDFGFNFLANLVVVPADKRPELRLPAFFIPLDNYNTPVRFSEWFERKWRERKAPFQTRKSGYFSMLAAEEAYIELSHWSKDRREYEEILFLINDVTWLIANRGADEKLLARTLESEHFRFGVLRSAAAYRAYRSGYEVGFRHHDGLADARVSLSISANLPGFDAPHMTAISYVDSEVFEDRVHCFVGPNGAGKTQLLRRLILSLARQVDKENPFLDVADNEYRAAECGELPKFKRVISYTTEVESKFPSGVKADSSFDYQHFNLSLPDWNVGAQRQSISSMLIDLLRGDHLRSRFNRIGALRAAVEKHLDWETIAVALVRGAEEVGEIKANGRRWIRFSNLHQLGEGRLLTISSNVDTDVEVGFFDSDGRGIEISSGQRTFLRFAIHFLSYASKAGLIIIDEPETHLHPNLVSAFAVLLYRVLMQTKSVAVVATHSPFFAREMPSHCVHVFRKIEPRAVEISYPFLRTLGASPTSLSMAIFGDDLVEKYHEKMLREKKLGSLSVDELLGRYGEILSPEMLMEIRARAIRRLEEKG